MNMFLTCFEYHSAKKKIIIIYYMSETKFKTFKTCCIVTVPSKIVFLNTAMDKQNLQETFKNLVMSFLSCQVMSFSSAYSVRVVGDVTSFSPPFSRGRRVSGANPSFSMGEKPCHLLLYGIYYYILLLLQTRNALFFCMHMFTLFCERLLNSCDLLASTRTPCMSHTALVFSQSSLLLCSVLHSSGCEEPITIHL